MRSGTSGDRGLPGRNAENRRGEKQNEEEGEVIGSAAAGAVRDCYEGSELANGGNRKRRRRT